MLSFNGKLSIELTKLSFNLNPLSVLGLTVGFNGVSLLNFFVHKPPLAAVVLFN